MTKTNTAGSNPAENSGRKIVLLAVTGRSPAILTETVWALAFPTDGRKPMIPDRVIAITTADGRGCIKKELFTPSAEYGGKVVWDELRRAIARRHPEAREKLRFGTTGDDVRVFTAGDQNGRSIELNDIATARENLQAADFILEQVRGIAQNPDCRLIASMAGGRKTMGALLYAAMTLLGRGEDRLTHVLVSEPFESPALKPRFYFPMGNRAHELPDRTGGQAVKSSSARLQLADVPFVRLHKLFPQQLGRLPGNFSALVELYSGRVEEIGAKPSVRLLADELALEVNGRRIELDFREWCVYSYFLVRLREGLSPHVTSQKEQEKHLQDFLAASAPARRRFVNDAQKDWSGATIEDLRRKLTTLKKKFEMHGLKSLLPYLLPTRRRFGIAIEDIDHSGFAGGGSHAAKTQRSGRTRSK